ncbi:MAG: phosphoglycerate kinase [Amphiamblys sp. WSBS2006]|nr:MAG: phosphoglycerate kinase [Amphiamblys sp. WSBS2006]
MKTLRDGEFRDRRVLLRVDYNVPIRDGGVADSRKIASTLPTIEYILSQRPKNIVIMSHLGRPKGKHVGEMSLRPVAGVLGSLLSKDVLFIEDCVGDDVCGKVQGCTSGEVVLLENLRFHKEETADIEKAGDGERESVFEFRRRLTSYGDVFVSDAFGCLHRAHSSVCGIDLPERYCGLLVENELRKLSIVTSSAEKIDLVIVGGAKVRDKIQLIRKLCEKTKKIILCGGMSFTFLSVLYGTKIGNSLFDAEGAKSVPEVMSVAKEHSVEIFFPSDFVVSETATDEAVTKTVSVSEGVPDGWGGFDCGPLSRKRWREIILDSRVILWNGPAGMFEMKPFEDGTRAVLDALVDATKQKGATTIIGGGETAMCAMKWGAGEKLTHVSTGGGAVLELLEGKRLPGLVFLDKKEV